MKESEKRKNGRKKAKTHDTRSKNGNKENENQGPTLELKNTDIQENRVQKALTDSSNLNTNWEMTQKPLMGKVVVYAKAIQRKILLCQVAKDRKISW